MGDHLGEKGKEFGTVTKRKRRCGWFDANLVKQSVKISGIDDVILTKLDVLDEIKEIKICVGYTINDSKYDYLPSNENLQNNIKPIYKIIPGWQKSTFGVNKWSDLPENAQKYVNAIQDMIETKISVISTGPERSQTIDKGNYLDSI